MLTFEEIVQGYAREGNAEALRHLRTITEAWCAMPGCDLRPMTKAILQCMACSRIAVIDNALRTLEAEPKA